MQIQKVEMFSTLVPLIIKKLSKTHIYELPKSSNHNIIMGNSIEKQKLTQESKNKKTVIKIWKLRREEEETLLRQFKLASEL